MSPSETMPWRTVLAGMSATLVGIGLARFAYSPLLPVLIAQGWFSPGAAAYLGAANLLGYLGGALAARHTARRTGTVPLLRASMLAATLSLAACCVPMPFAWFFAWRLVSGIAGGFLMILGPSSVLAHVPVARRGFASGLILTGVGLGVAASGTLVPLLLEWGLTEAWLGLAFACLVLSAVSWNFWPDMSPPAIVAEASPTVRFAAVSVSYGLCAVSMVPHMVFLVDFVARGLGRGLAAGAGIWVLFGAGALVGPIVAGRLADRIGAAATMRLMMLTTALCLLLLLGLSSSWLAVAVSAVVGGMLTPGITAMMLGRIVHMAGVDPASRQRGWTFATIAWGLGQAAGAYGMAWLYNATGGYASVFRLALLALAISAAIETVLAVQPRHRMAT